MNPGISIANDRYCKLLIIVLFFIPAQCLAYGSGSSPQEFHFPWLIKLLLILGGLGLLLAGFYIFEFFIALPGFIIGAAIGAIVLYSVNVIAAILGAIFLGLIGAAIAVIVSQLLVFLIGALLGALLAGGLCTLVTHSTPAPIFVVIGAGVGGIVTLKLWKFCIVIVSSAIGALIISIGTDMLQTVWFPVLLTLVGSAVQYGLLSYYGFPDQGIVKGRSRHQLFPKRGSMFVTKRELTSNPPKDPKMEVCPFCREASFKAIDKCEICGLMKR